MSHAHLAVVLFVTGLAPQMATAHFLLHSPVSWRAQGPFGDPQKKGPCGNDGLEPLTGLTGLVTAFAPGETITISFDETIFHPGHYRVALAVNDRNELPAEPPVTPGATACGSVPIMNPPVFPVLADGVLHHADPFSDRQSFQVTLPASVTCTHCTLQVLEFMSNHFAPCFYHHCADISIRASPGTCTTDADCVDDNGCTSDHCNLATSACENPDTVTPTCDDSNACTTDTCERTTGECVNTDTGNSTCDDGNACTQDACRPAQGCVHLPITLADASAGFLGVLSVVPCSTERVPPAVGILFDKADTLVTRAVRNRAKAQRLLNRAGTRLRGAATKVTKVQGRRISIECGTALGELLGRAQTRVQCLRGGV